VTRLLQELTPLLAVVSHIAKVRHPADTLTIFNERILSRLTYALPLLLEQLTVDSRDKVTSFYEQACKSMPAGVQLGLFGVC
jgi:hypothetical protein